MAGSKWSYGMSRSPPVNTTRPADVSARSSSCTRRTVVRSVSTRLRSRLQKRHTPGDSDGAFSCLASQSVLRMKLIIGNSAARSVPRSASKWAVVTPSTLRLGTWRWSDHGGPPQ